MTGQLAIPIVRVAVDVVVVSAALSVLIAVANNDDRKFIDFLPFSRYPASGNRVEPTLRERVASKDSPTGKRAALY